MGFTEGGTDTDRHVAGGDVHMIRVVTARGGCYKYVVDRKD